MADYLAGDFEAAVVGLGAALTAGIEPAPAEFFRGASLLMLDRPEEATGAFDAVVAAGESPYLAEAHFYRAKALLRLGRAADAQNSLEASAAVAGRGSAVAASARALSDSLEALVGG
jgi:tetratricopeptide (TPR) repeat protein